MKYLTARLFQKQENFYRFLKKINLIFIHKNKLINIQIKIKSLEIFEGKDKDMLVELTKLCTQRTR